MLRVLDRQLDVNMETQRQNHQQRTVQVVKEDSSKVRVVNLDLISDGTLTKTFVEKKMFDELNG